MKVWNCCMTMEEAKLWLKLLTGWDLQVSIFRIPEHWLLETWPARVCFNPSLLLFSYFSELFIVVYPCIPLINYFLVSFSSFLFFCAKIWLVWAVYVSTVMVSGSHWIHSKWQMPSLWMIEPLECNKAMAKIPWISFSYWRASVDCKDHYLYCYWLCTANCTP